MDIVDRKIGIEVKDIGFQYLKNVTSTNNMTFTTVTTFGAFTLFGEFEGFVQFGGFGALSVKGLMGPVWGLGAVRGLGLGLNWIFMVIFGQFGFSVQFFVGIFANFLVGLVVFVEIINFIFLEDTLYRHQSPPNE